ncbi:MAG UNVERIFIED_CONTAM: hypothetical protein LVR18_12310 [Planctomycetaceae bacterium]|jgi:hypothetical protein
MVHRYQLGDRLLFHGRPRRCAARWEFNTPEVHALPADEDSEELPPACSRDIHSPMASAWMPCAGSTGCRR